MITTLLVVKITKIMSPMEMKTHKASVQQITKAISIAEKPYKILGTSLISLYSGYSGNLQRHEIRQTEGKNKYIILAQKNMSEFRFKGEGIYGRP